MFLVASLLSARVVKRQNAPDVTEGAEAVLATEGFRSPARDGKRGARRQQAASTSGSCADARAPARRCRPGAGKE